MVPDEYAQPIPGATLPDPVTAGFGDWVAFGNSQSGQLDKANRRVKAVLDIYARCEAHDNALVKSLTHRGLF